MMMMMVMMIITCLSINVNVFISKQIRLKKECYLIRQDNTIYTFSITLYFSSIGQDKSKLQKQISKLLILIETAA